MLAGVGPFRERLVAEYERRFPRSSVHFQRHAHRLLDGCSHAVRWNDPFMPVMARASGAHVVDLDGSEFVDYWQGHFANLLGHNPPLIRDALVQALEDGRVKPHANLLLTGFGAGLTWSAHVVRWGERITPLGQSDVELPPCERSALEIVQGIRKAKRGSKLAE